MSNSGCNQLTHSLLPQTILVPQGAEYKAVCRGLSGVKLPKPWVVPIPIGSKPVTHYLERWQQTEDFLTAKPSSILLMGLCGSLSPQLAVGDMALYHDCVYMSNKTTTLLRSCDRLTRTITSTETAYGGARTQHSIAPQAWRRSYLGKGVHERSHHCFC